MLLDILLAVLVVVCIALIGVILLQRSEGGALGMSGGGPGAFMTARGTGDLLTRTTQILAAVFFLLCLLMTIIAGHEHGTGSLVDKMKLNSLGTTSLSSAPASSAPAPVAPLMPGGALNPLAPLGPNTGAQQPAQQNNGVNLLGAPQQPLTQTTLKPSAAPKAVKTVKTPSPKLAAPTAAAPAPAASPPSAPAVSPAPLAVPAAPSAPATPANGQ